MSDLALHPELPARWPAAVRAELTRRHQVLAGRARGRVLDLSGPDGRAVVTAAAAGEAAGAFDVVLSVGGLARFADLPSTVAVVAGLLAPDGELLACEPAGRPGWGPLLAASAASLVPASRGTHLVRDVVGAVRGAGLVCDIVERFELPTALPTLRHAVALRAVPDPGSAR